jgi:branched-chain amino acid transport system substrate-binding protein
MRSQDDVAAWEDTRGAARRGWIVVVASVAMSCEQPRAWITRRTFIGTVFAVTGAAGLLACTTSAPSLPPNSPPSPPVAEAQPSPSPSPLAAPAQSESELAVGAVLSLTGRYSREGALIRAGYEVWMDVANQAGGVKVGAGRRTVRLTVLDDESEPLNASRLAERLASGQRVRLWLGPFTSAITTAVATVADRVGALVVAPDASANGLYRRGFKGLVSVLGTDDRLLHGLADLAATAQPRAQPIGLLVADEPSNVAAAAGFRERAAALDLGPVRLELTALGSHDVSAPLERIAADSPRCVIVATESGQTERFTPTMRELIPFASMRVLVPLPTPASSAEPRDPIYDGVLTVETWWPTIAASGPVIGSARAFVERFKRLHGYDPEPRCAAATAAGLVLQLALEQAGSAEPSTVREAFSTLDVTTFWGRLAWDTSGRNRVAVPPTLQQQDDRIVAVYPREVESGQLRYPLAGWPRR